MARLVDTYRGAVYPWHCDHMGHMNVMWYVGKFDEATWQFFALLGLTAELPQPPGGCRPVAGRIEDRLEPEADPIQLLQVRDRLEEA